METESLYILKKEPRKDPELAYSESGTINFVNGRVFRRGGGGGSLFLFLSASRAPFVNGRAIEDALPGRACDTGVCRA